jgi:hypothetical protein
MQAFLQNCPQDYEDDTEVASPMPPQDVASLQECVGENTKSPLKTQTASPTCVSQIPEKVQRHLPASQFPKPEFGKN